MNHLNNQSEELAPQPNSNSDRHFEMFLERSRFTGWMFVVSISVAVIILFKVLTPFQGLNEELVAHSTELAVLKQQKQELVQRRNGIEEVSQSFASLQHRIKNPSWAGAPKQLAGEMRELNRSYRVLLDASNEDLLKSIEEQKKNDDAVGQLIGTAQAIPASFQEEETNPGPGKWMSPPTTSQDENLAESAELAADAPLNKEQLHALQAYFEASERVREMGLLTNPIELSEKATPSESERSEPDMPQEPAWMNVPPPSISDAVQTLDVTAEELTNFTTFRERDTFLYEKLQVRAQEEAHKVLDRVANAARAEIVTPLAESLEALHAIDLGHISDEFDQLGTSLDDWVLNHRAESSWYQSFATKGETIVGLGQSIGNVLANTSAALHQQSRTVAAERATMDYQLGEMGKEKAALKERKASIHAKLDSIMPVWLGGVVTAPQLIQIFPLLLIVLVLVLSYNVWMVRDHYLLSRIEGVDKAPYKSASIWTLVQRGGFRTIVSLATFLSGIAILWFNYEQAAFLMTRWAALDISSPWMFTGWISEAAPWIGRTVFLAAASAVVLSLLWREQAPADPELAQ